MPLPSEEELDDSETPTEGAVKPGLTARVTAQDEAANMSRALATLAIRDPEIGAILRARAAGKKPKVSFDDEIREEVRKTDQAQAPNFDEMNEQQKMQWMVQETLNGLKSEVGKLTQPLTQQIEQLQGYANSQEAQRAGDEVTRLREQYPDFNDYTDKMLELSNQHPNLKAFQLYSLAKTEAGSPVVTARSTAQQLSSERPVSTTARPAANAPRKKPMAPGVLGLRQAIRGSAEGLRTRLTDGDFMMTGAESDD